MRLEQAFADIAAQFPNDAALVWNGSALTYAQLANAAQVFTERLRTLGVGAGDLVALRMRRAPEYIAAVLGVLAAGGAYVPLDSRDPPQRVQRAVQKTRPRVVISDEPADELQYYIQASGAGTCLTWQLRREPSVLSRRHEPGRVRKGAACLMSTSGSTGEMKFVIVPHRAILNLVRNRAFGFLRSDDVFLFHSSPAFDASTFEIWAPLLHGARLVIAPQPWSTARDMAERIVNAGVTTLWLPAALFELMVDFELDSLRGLRTLIAGGDIVSARHMREAYRQLPGVRLMNGYGPTECTTFTCCFTMTTDYAEAEAIPIGQPLEKLRIRIGASNGRRAGNGVEGVLQVSGAGLADGYFDDAKATAAAFRSSPVGGRSPGRWYLTGDLVRRRTDGNLDFVGRSDNQIKLSGHRVEPEEIERVLNAHPEVAKAVVGILGDRALDKHLVAYVVARTNDQGAETARRFEDDYVTSWKKVYDAKIYKGLTTTDRPATFDTTGWTDSYTGAPIGDRDMETQVAATVARIKCHAPRKILEVGCGTGLLMHRLLPDCERYVGADVSETAVAFTRESLTHHGGAAARAIITVLPAHRIAELEDEDFDCVILNSVVQHFPSLDYLELVLRECVRKSAPNALIFVGDVRALPLLRAFQTSVQLHRLPPATPIRNLRSMVDTRLSHEQELIVHPAFFRDRFLTHLGIGASSVHLKVGKERNELNCFRYDAMLYVAPGNGPAIAQTMRVLNGQACDLDEILVQARWAAGSAVLLTDVSNARVLPALAAVRLMDDDHTSGTAGEVAQCMRQLSGAGVDPEDVWVACRELNIPACVLWPGSGRPDRFDVCLGLGPRECRSPIAPAGMEASRGPKPEVGRLANQPALPAWRDALESRIRVYLHDRLPAHMLPSRFEWVDALPIDDRGKLDRASIGRLLVRSNSADVSCGAVERLVMDVWSDVLEAPVPDPDTNFFDIGGNSLMAIRAVAKLGFALGVHVPAHTLFESLTVRRLAAEIVARLNSEGRAPMVPDAPGGANEHSSSTRHRTGTS